MTKIILEFTTSNGIESLEYQLADNPIAKTWLEKIRHLQHVPVDQATLLNSQEEFNALKKNFERIYIDHE
jgi:hypothetical protein